MRKLLLIGFVLLHLGAMAQVGRGNVPKVEREIAAYLKSAKDSLLVNLSHTIQASQQAIGLARAYKLIASEQQCYRALASFYLQYEKYDLVVRNFDRAIALDLSNSTELQYEKLPFLDQITDVDKGIRDANTIAKIAHKQGNEAEESNALIVLGNIYGKRGDYEKSIIYLERAEALVSTNDIQKQAVVQGYLGDNYNQMNQNGRAEDYYRNAFDYGSEVKDTSVITSNFDRLNDIYRQEKRNSDIISLNNAVTKRGVSKSVSKSTPKAESEKTIDVPDIREKDEFWTKKVQKRANINLAAAHLENNSNETAIEILEEMQQAVDVEDDLQGSSEVHKLLSQAYDQSGKYAEALKEYKTYVAIQDSLLTQKDAQIEATMQKNEALQDLENHVVFLEKDKELDAKTIALSESNVRRQRTISIAAFLIAIIGLFSLIVVIRKSRAKTAANNLLELKSLRTKMNPHFIFNSLNSVNHFIAQNDEKAANKYLSKFSRLMRDILDSSDKDFIPLDKEIELLQVYLELEHQRFEDKFNYSLTVEPNVKAMDMMIPPMLVQPFIENAIWHGLRYIDHPGVLTVSFYQRDGNLMIEVEDNGIGRAASQALKTKNQRQHQSTGISNSESRIDLTNKVYGEAISISFADKNAPETGTLVQIEIKGKHGD